MAKKHVNIGDLNESAALNLSEDDLCKVTGGLLPANVYRTANKVRIEDRVDSNTNNIIAVLIGL
jgi:hypothetical protein